MLAVGQVLGQGPPLPIDESALRRAPASEIAPSDRPVAGSPSSTKRYVIFSDLQCPFCRAEYDRLKPMIDAGEIAVTFRHFPLPMHPFALLAANLSELAGKRGQFWHYVDLCFTRDPKTKGDFVRFARQCGVPPLEISDKLSTDAGSMPRVKEDIALGKGLEIRGVPLTLALSPGGGAVEVIPPGDEP